MYCTFSGLIDAGESIADAAVRELKEETGYVAQIKHTSPGRKLHVVIIIKIKILTLVKCIL